MTQPNLKYRPILWLSAGVGITLVIVAIAAVLLLPNLIREQEVPVTLTPSSTSVAISAATAIPTFTSSPTLTPSLTPTSSLTPTPTETPSPTPTETPTVTPSTTPTPPPQIHADQDTRLYQGPAADYPEQGWLVEGSWALIISQLEGGEWWYVETERGIRGWVVAEDVTAENDLSTLPVVTPWPRGATAPPPPPSPAPIIGPLELSEIWPTAIIACESHFELDVWIRAHGGTGVFTYLVNDEIIAEGIVGDGATARIVSPGSAWVGVISVISGDLRVDREMYFAPADWCSGE